MPDLAGAVDRARERVASLLIDTGTLKVDADGIRSATLNPETLALVEPDDDTDLWTGDCLLTPLTPEQQVVAPGDSRKSGRWRLLLPHTAPVPVVDVTTFTLTTCQMDSTLVGVPLVVRSVEQSSVLVFRELTVDRA